MRNEGKEKESVESGDQEDRTGRRELGWDGAV